MTPHAHGTQLQSSFFPHSVKVGWKSVEADPPAATAATGLGTLVVLEGDANDNERLCQRLRTQFPSTRVIAFQRGAAALEFCLHAIVSFFVLNVELPDLSGVDVIRRLKAAGCHCPVVVMTGCASHELLNELWELGVPGVIDKDSADKYICTAVESVQKGGLYFSTRVEPDQASDVGEKKSTAQPELHVKLSRREKEVAQLVVAGLLSKQVADRLGLSTRTVEKYRARLMQKLGAQGVADLVYWCIQHGVTRSEDKPQPAHC